MLFQKKTAISFPSYDPERQQAVLKCSICTGEQVAGFLDRQTGHFTDVMLIRNGKDLEAFQKHYKLLDQKVDNAPEKRLICGK